MPPVAADEALEELIKGFRARRAVLLAAVRVPERGPVIQVAAVLDAEPVPEHRVQRLQPLGVVAARFTAAVVLRHSTQAP